jgi:tetratricopeptide (TPR) repeat protein
MTSTSRKRGMLAGLVLLLVGIAGWLGWRWHEKQAPANAFHLYVLGGSSAWGEPYAPHIEDLLGRLVAMHFDDRIGGKPVRVVTLAEAASDITRVAEMAQEIVRRRHAPGTAVALVYAGHNEFIAVDDHRDLRASPRRLIDEPVVPPDRREAAFDEFRAALARITDSLRVAHVPVILSTVAANVRDWDPNRSTLSDPANAEQVTALWTAAKADFDARRFTAAAVSLEALLALEPGFAHACFLLGRCRLELGDPAGAARWLQRAADTDANPTRVTSEQNRIIVEHGRERRVPVADALHASEAASPEGLVGFNQIWDNVHPRLEAFVLIAGAFARELELLTGTKRKRNQLSLSGLEAELGIDRALHGHILAGRGQTCYGHATRTWAPERRLTQAERYFNEALNIHPTDANLLCSIAVMQLLRGDTGASLATWRRARLLDPEVAESRIGNLHVRQLFERAGIEDAWAAIAE